MADNPKYGLSVQYMSGVDTRIYIKGNEVAHVQAISWTIQREKVANYTMGRVDPISISRGKRGVGGSLVRLVFHGDAWLNDDFYTWADEASYMKNLLAHRKTSNLTSDINTSYNVVEFRDGNAITKIRSVMKTWYVDQLPPFTICMINANEHGKISRAYLVDVEFVNQAGSVSIDDINVAESMTFLARTFIPWHEVPISQAASNISNPYTNEEMMA